MPPPRRQLSCEVRTERNTKNCVRRMEWNEGDRSEGLGGSANDRNVRAQELGCKQQLLFLRLG